jgi:signal transduction histidine kinase
MNSSPKTERTRLARELHDGLAQELAAFGYRLDQVIGDENLGNSNSSTLRELRRCLSSMINQVRDEIYELRSNKGKDFHA